jgi:hypothetical protein
MLPSFSKRSGLYSDANRRQQTINMPLREFRDLADANQQLMDWVMQDAGNRLHGTTRTPPLKRFVETEQAMLKPLPNSAPECARWATAKLSVHKGLIARACHREVRKALTAIVLPTQVCSSWLIWTHHAARSEHLADFSSYEGGDRQDKLALAAHACCITEWFSQFYTVRR